MENLEPCELCGRPNKLKDCIIEGTLISVCESCTKYGSLVEGPKKIEITKKRKIKLMEEKEFISKNYPNLIKQAREALELKQQQLAQLLGEKESVIHQLESGHLEPSMVLAKKLENFLKIKLIETYEEPNEKINLTDATLTIGDLIKLKKK